MSERNNAPATLPKLLDLVVYVLALTSLTYAVASVLAIVLGAGLTLVVHATFVLGFLMLGYATFLLWPSRPWETKVTDDGKLEVVNKESDESVGSREETRFQSAVQRLPPLAQYSIPPSDRLSPGTKLFVTSFAVLIASFVTEAVFVT